jgi:hypothetical protein
MAGENDKYRDRIKKADDERPKCFEKPAAVVNKIPDKGKKKSS